MSRTGTHNTIVILEDNTERTVTMRQELSQRLPNLNCIIFSNAPDMIAWLKDPSSSMTIVSLDHDLEPFVENGRSVSEPGTGRDVANYLAAQQPTCPVIVHTTSQFGGDGMQFALEDANWRVERVVPFGGISWIRQAWLPTVLELLKLPR
jgi:hypothetical protein